MAHSVAVAYTGKIVEYGDVYTIFKYPRHPYTYGLLNSVPSLKTEKLKPHCQLLKVWCQVLIRCLKGATLILAVLLRLKDAERACQILLSLSHITFVRCFHPVAAEKEAYL